MKKLVLSVFLCLLVLCLTLPCFASFKLSETYFFAENYQEYKKGLRERKQKMPSNFISYDRVSFLGEFLGCRCEDLERNAYVYFLLSPEGQDLTVAFNTSPESTSAGKPVNSYVIGVDVNLVRSDMLTIDIDRLLFILGMDDFYDTFILEFCVYDWADNEVLYYYDWQGDLQRIVLKFDGEYCAIKTDFAQCAPDSWVGRLLSDPETAREAAIEMKMRLAGTYEEPWEEPVLVGVAAVVGVSIAILVTFFVMRKRRGTLAPAPAMAGAPAGEVLAGSDVDASTATVGAAPAAPESPTPPEEDTKTDDFDRS